MARKSEKAQKTERGVGGTIVHFFVRLFSIIFAIVLLAADLLAAVYLLPLFEHNIQSDNQITNVDAGQEGVMTSQNWMVDLPDDTNLADVNLPGSHDAGTKYISLPLILKCQDSTIEDQLNDGYRYLDIRLGSENIGGVRELVLTHSDFICQYSRFSRQPLTLDSVLKECYNFLQENKSETIVFNIKQEVEDISLEEFQTILKKETDQNPDYWYLGSSLPTVGEARGKIVLCRRYEDAAGLGEEAGVLLAWDEQDNAYNAADPASYVKVEEENKTVLYVQDRYCYSVNDKWNVFRQTIEDRPAVSSKENAVTINFLSTKGIFPVGNPYYFACQLNRKFMDYVSAGVGEGEIHPGWVVADFGSEELARAIYMTNYPE